MSWQRGHHGLLRRRNFSSFSLLASFLASLVCCAWLLPTAWIGGFPRNLTSQPRGSLQARGAANEGGGPEYGEKRGQLALQELLGIARKERKDQFPKRGSRNFSKWVFVAFAFSVTLCEVNARTGVLSAIGTLISSSLGKPSMRAGLSGFLFMMMAAFIMPKRNKNAGSNGSTFNKQSGALDAPSVSFADIAGAEKAKEQVTEVVEMLKNIDVYSALGARVPRGVLLAGPPGTGKTLFARACAGEGGLPFINAAGTEFIEMFAGRGAARVRKLFEQAKRRAPCIVFIDEIDAVGRARGNSAMKAGDHEAEQTLNQLLVSMDGLNSRDDASRPVVVIAATNRPEVLDKALLRPGRFDRFVEMTLPDADERLAILRTHIRLKGLPLAADVSPQALADLAQRCDGFSGASLETLVNEAAICAARRHVHQARIRCLEGCYEDKDGKAANQVVEVLEEDFQKAFEDLGFRSFPPANAPDTTNPHAD